MKFKILTIAKVIIGLAMFAWFGIFLAHKIDLTTADLGRHLENGSIIIHGSWQDRWAVLHTNFYSYSLPNAPFVNHHWLSGVVFYVIFRLSGFVGLSVFYVALGLLTLLLFFDVARKASNFWIATAATIIVIPLITSRAEVRPEMFTYFFTGVFFWALYYWRLGILKHNRLLVLPVVMLVWVNLHIGFVFGLLVLGAFGLERLIKVYLPFRASASEPRNLLNHNLNRSLHYSSDALRVGRDGAFRVLLFISALCLVAGLINPFGYKILMYPFLIFTNYGYLIVENQSIKFLENLNHTVGLHFVLFKVVVGALGILFLASLIKNFRKFDVAMLVLVLVTAVMAYLGIRNFPSFAFFALPALAASFYSLKPSFKIHPAYIAALCLLVVPLVGYCLNDQYADYENLQPILGVGLLPGANASADFYNTLHIEGPVFNNYDIGGYLIWNLYPQKVFVDNRPEAYTNDFFQKIYIPAQQDEQKWQELDKQYNFNSIFFAYHDLTPWAQTFLISRINDKNWVPVYADGYNIIFVRLARKNLDIIAKYEIPRDRFSVYKPE